MKQLMEKMLTDRDMRDTKAMSAYLAQVSDVGEPWFS
jgi:hypothetical protein